MLHFLQNFVYYMTVEVISPRAHEMTAGDVWPIIIYICILACIYLLVEHGRMLMFMFLCI
jgi:hypothetical protein